ncbi:MAG: sulfite exporter TauE/SafE family protein [Acidobacteria bacterium]|nr:sulfite exporter TauE/SafE family protein [Acidobacteriota bacterium]
MKELDAFGTSLAAMVPPAGLRGAIEYYRHGNTNVKYAAVLALGLLIGIYFGARLAVSLPPGVARRIYGGFLLVVAIRFLAGR